MVTSYVGNGLFQIVDFSGDHVPNVLASSGHGDTFYDVAWRPRQWDSQMLAIVSGDGHLLIFNLYGSNLKLVRNSNESHSKEAVAVSWNEGQDNILTAAWDDTVKLVRSISEYVFDHKQRIMVIKILVGS